MRAIYQVLWHRVTVDAEIPARLRATPLPTWSVEPVVEVDYRIAAGPESWILSHRGDLVAHCADIDSALAQLDARVGAEAFELAARRGWVPFRGAVIRRDNRRIGVLGSPDAIAAEPGLVESNDGCVMRDGEYLAAPFNGRSSVRQLGAAAIDDLHVVYPGQAARRAELVDLMAAAERGVLSNSEIVHAVSQILRTLPVSPLS